MLDLMGNDLQWLDPSWQPTLSSIGVVYLADNPWHCNCQLRWLKQVTGPRYHSSDAVVCATPQPLAFTEVARVPDNQMVCHPPQVGCLCACMLTKTHFVYVYFIASAFGHFCHGRPREVHTCRQNLTSCMSKLHCSGLWAFLPWPSSSGGLRCSMLNKTHFVYVYFIVSAFWAYLLWIETNEFCVFFLSLAKPAAAIQRYPAY